MSRRHAGAAMAIVCASIAVEAQSLGDVAKRIEEARRTRGTTAVVYDERDMNPALARRDVLELRIDPQTWQDFLRADRLVGRAIAPDPDLVRRLEGLNYVTIRSAGRFFEREPPIARALQAAGTNAHAYANTYLAIKLALSDHIEAVADVPLQNRVFLASREREVKGLALPLDAFSLHALGAPGRANPAAAGPGVRRPADMGAIGTRPSAVDRPGARAELAAASGVIDMSAGALIPDFEFVDFDGRRRQLSDFRGKYLMLDFWGSWCPPCRAEVPFVRDAYARFGSRGFDVLGMDHERSATVDQVRGFLNRNGVQWTFATPDSVRSLINERFQITSFPRVILLDPEGRVIEARNSALRGENLARTLDGLLPR